MTPGIFLRTPAFMKHLLLYFRHQCVCWVMVHDQPLLLITVALEPGKLFRVVSVATTAT